MPIGEMSSVCLLFFSGEGEGFGEALLLVTESLKSLPLMSLASQVLLKWKVGLTLGTAFDDSRLSNPIQISGSATGSEIF